MMFDKRVLKHKKDAAVSWNKNAKNYTEETWRNISFSEGKLTEFLCLCVEERDLLSCSLDLHGQKTKNFYFWSSQSYKTSTHWMV
jgi:hypothetical protein